MNCILYQKTPPHTNSRFPHKEPIVSALYVWAGLCSVWCYVSKTRLIYVSPVVLGCVFFFHNHTQSEP